MKENSSQDSSRPNKIRVGIFFGGKSAEHDVSINSAKNVLEALDTTKFTPVLIGIDREGHWHSVDSPALLNETLTQPGIDPLDTRHLSIDVAFPILHGPYGEDGSMQGLFEIADIPYVGPGVLSSAINMDKDVSKRLLKAAGIAVAPFLSVRLHNNVTFRDVKNALGLPVFIKPANMGSSIGVSKAATEEEFAIALDNAFEYDNKVLIEGVIVGQEIECSVLGNNSPKASVIGRIIPNTAAFYDYTAKYIDEDGALLEIPADLDPQVAKAAQKTAIEAYKILECEGMSRVDMFVTKDNEIVVNELNTIPGFTSISMYPKLWEVSGISYTDLITELIELAIERHAKRSHLKTLPL